MSNSNKNSLRVHPKDSNSTSRDKNEKLLEIVRRLERENKKLKSQYKTMEAVWDKTEKKYKEAVREIPLSEMMESEDWGVAPLKKKVAKGKCSKCISGNLKKIDFDGFCVVRCNNCDYRNRIDDKSTS